MRRIITLSVCVVLGVLGIYAQGSAAQSIRAYVGKAYRFNQICPQEKVYLHFDNTSYYQGDVIWFAASVVNATNLRPASSKVLYVELLSADGILLKQLKLKVIDGRASGSIPLVDMSTDEARALRGAMPYPSGFYEVRAYTRTMLNFDDAGIFSRVFPVYETPKEEGDYEKVIMNPVSDPKVKVRPSVQKKKKVNISFFPEGGHLIKGVPNRVAFEAVDEWGRGLPVIGTLKGDDDEVENSTLLTTLHDGMGYFTFVPDKRRHSVRISYGDDDYLFRLPDAEDEGYALQVDNMSDARINVGVQSSDTLLSEVLGVALMCRGAVVYADTLSVSGGKACFSVDKTKFPAGVYQLTVFGMNGRGKVVRQLFISDTQAIGRVGLTMDKQHLLPYDAVSMQVHTCDGEGRPIPATLSLSVRDALEAGTGYSEDIRTQLLLSSDLRGYIHQPEYYFESEDRAHRAALDLLMMTHGWMRYNWNQMAGVEPFEVKHYVEDGLVLDGVLLNKRRDKPIPGATVTMKLTSPDRQQKQETSVQTDEQGRFGFSIQEFDGKWDMSLFVTKDGKQLDARMRLDRASRPVLRTWESLETCLPDIVVVKDSIALTLLEEQRQMENPDSVVMLDNVTIEGKKKYIDYLTFKAFNAEEDTEFEYDSGRFTYKVSDYLAEKGYDIDNTEYTGVVPDEIRERDSFIEWSLHQCLINNKRVLWYLHDEHRNLATSAFTPGFDVDMEDVKSIIVYDSPYDYLAIPAVRESLSPLQIEAINAPLKKGDMVVGRGLYVVDISMYPKGLRKTRSKGTRMTCYRGYSPVVEYYAPEYPNGPIQGDADYRRTLYWNPNLTTDDKGQAEISFYNNAYSTAYSISAEGITDDGVILLNEQ